jgi:hypothetical protein
MDIRAENDPRYFYKFLVMGILALGGALWFLKDAVIGYPAELKQGFADFKTDYKAFFRDENRKAMSLEEFEAVADPEKLLEWQRYIEKRDIHNGPAIVMQYIMAGVCSVLGLWLVSMPLRARGRWIRATDDGITSSWGESFQFDEVELVNKRSWRKKGIAKVTYVADNRRRTFVLDDYKFDRYPTDAILYELEQRIDAERITGGPPEPPPDAEGDNVLAAASGPENANGGLDALQ